MIINRSLISCELYLRPALYVAGNSAELSDSYAFLLSRHGLIVNQIFIISLCKASSALPWEPEVFFLVCDEELRRSQADSSSAERRHERRSSGTQGTSAQVC